MRKANAVSTAGEDFEAKPDEGSNSVNQETFKLADVCPSCGVPRKEFLDTCTECGVVLEPVHRTDDMVPCPTCDGSGVIFLNYLAEYATMGKDGSERRLPCADCDGTGAVPRRVIIDRQSKRARKNLAEFLLNLLDIFLRPRY